MESVGVLRSRYGWISQNSFRAWKRQLEIRKTGSDKMADVQPAENVERKTTENYQSDTKVWPWDLL